MANFLLSLSYDGGNYFGWIIQPHQRTIQGALNQAIKRVTKTTNFKTLGASKTDAGVHALDQKVILNCDFEPSDLKRFQLALNKALPKDIFIKELTMISADFNLHKMVKQKTYRYTLNEKWSLETQRYNTLWIKKPLVVKELELIAQVFVGTHNFQNFSGLNQKEILTRNTIRQVDAIKVEQKGSQTSFIIQGPTFIRYQIRMMIGAIMAVYEGQKYQIEDLQKYLRNDKFQKFPKVISPEGLCLEKITLKDF